ncbi:hypothetical protein A3D88_01385 [Candidatus Peribacteria bacterium RIFCSPHIGHO2_02_FULL_52_16]|nr:MAG: hypothetical protein A3D88_01385 [Candidatus Peribacteria bacterium RIFCSPHIGHO2_02_FULL_52_16]
MHRNIVILSTFFTPFRSGAEACVEEVSRVLKDRYDITIITARLRHDLPKKDSLHGVNVIRVGFGIPFDKWLFPFSAAVKAHALHPVIIHAVLETFAGLALSFCRMTVPKARKLLTLQTTNRTFLKKHVIRSADRVTAISSVLQQVAQSYGREAVVIPNGLRLADIPVTEKIPGRILFVGRLEKMKGVDVLLKAFAALPTLAREQASLRIVGDGSERSALEALARDLKITDRVSFLGYVPTPAVYHEFAEAEIFCGLSRSEALGNVFLEAQAARCAVIATKVGGIPDIIKDRATGLLVPPDDADGARNAIETCLIDRSLAMKLAAAGKFHAQEYDWRSIAERYAEVYEEVLS